MTLSAKPRIEIVDALRGFALLGIIIAHMNNQYFAGFPAPGHNLSVKNSFDNVLENISGIFIVGKFFTIFSFLFGLSFGIQMLNAQEKNKPFIGRFAWRLVLLGLIGLLHQVHYRGDILTIYTVLGFFLLLFYRASPRWLLFWSFFFILNMPGLIFQVVNYIQSMHASGNRSGPDFAQMGRAATAYYDHVKSGDYLWLAKTNIEKEFQGKLMFQLFSGRLFITMGLFVLGLYAAKRRIFENLQLHVKGFKKWLWISLSISVACVLIYVLLGDKLNGPPSGLSVALGSILGWFDPALSMVYVSLIVIICQKPRAAKRFMGLVPVGRMGLTTYLVQTAFGLLFLYGYGFNQMDVVGNSVTFAAGILFFIIQVYLSRWWMERFYYGPFEWFWRSATLMKRQAFSKRGVGG